MAIRISPEARRRLDEILEYTDREWGERQADKYVGGLMKLIRSLGSGRRSRRTLPRTLLNDVLLVQYQHHYICYRTEPSGDVVVLTVLHERMDLPTRLEQDLKDEAGLGDP